MVDQRDLRMGMPMPDFRLHSSDGTEISVRDYRHWSPLVLFFMHDLGCAVCQEYLQRCADMYDEYRDWRVQVLAVAHGPNDEQGIIRRLRLPFAVLFDADKAAHRLYLENTGVGIVVLDRWNGLQMRQGASEATQLMSPVDALEWVAASEIACPECGVSEWPGT